VPNTLARFPLETRGIKYISAFYGDEGLVLPFEEGASQTFKAGDLVKLSAGAIITCGTNLAAQVAVGMALKPATGVTGAIIPVRVIRKSDVWSGRYQSDDTFAVADVTGGTGFDLVTEGASAAGEWVIDQDDAAPANARIFGSMEWSGAGTSLNAEDKTLVGNTNLAATAGGPVVFRFSQAATVFGATETN